MLGAQYLASLSGLRWQFGMEKQIQTKCRRGSTKDVCVSPWKKKKHISFIYLIGRIFLYDTILMSCTLRKMLLRMSLELYWAWTERTKIHLMPELDLKELNIKEKFHHKTIRDRTVFCGTTFTLTKNEKELLCKVLASVRLLDEFSSNIARCVREKENKLLGIKSHDCDIIMKYFLPIGVLCALPTEVVPVLLELSSFFQNLSTKVGTAIYFHSLSKSVAVLFCELEKLLPPAFFVIMLHLLINLPDEAAIVGLVHYRWMYPIE